MAGYEFNHAGSLITRDLNVEISMNRDLSHAIHRGEKREVFDTVPLPLGQGAVRRVGQSPKEI